MLILNYSPSIGACIGRGCAKRAYELSKDVVIKISRAPLTSRQYGYLLENQNSIPEIPIATAKFHRIMGEDNCGEVVQTVSEWVIWEYAKKVRSKHVLCPILSYGITKDQCLFTVMPRLYPCPVELIQYSKAWFSGKPKGEAQKYRVWFRLIQKTERMFNLRDISNHAANYMVTKDLSHCYVVDYGCVVSPFQNITEGLRKGNAF